MPHQCTNCSLTFEDGSKQMLGGCPECGGNKFQFLPGGKTTASDDGDGERAETGVASSTPRSTVSATSTAPAGAPLEESFADGATSDTGRLDEDTGDEITPDDDIIEAPAEPIDAGPDGEDRAQASARRDVVSEDELPVVEAGAGDSTEEADAASSGDDRPDLTQLRQELNDQFESIKILRPGEYELNLMELYDRQEYIIALEEDGRYVIDVPDTWRDDP